MKHEAFMLGTSKLRHDSKGFELFITTAPIVDLNEKLIVFGRVVKGEDIVQVLTNTYLVKLLSISFQIDTDNRILLSHIITFILTLPANSVLMCSSGD